MKAKFANGELTQVVHATCACGREKSHERIRPHCVYSAWGLTGLIFFSWGTPKYVEFVCPDCKQILERSRDPAVRRKYK